MGRVWRDMMMVFFGLLVGFLLSHQQASTAMDYAERVKEQYVHCKAVEFPTEADMGAE